MHPLKTSWTLWYFKRMTNNWEQDQREIASFQSVEDFWAVINHIKEPSLLVNGCDYSVFRTGIKPMWEDPANRNGGRWVVIKKTTQLWILSEKQYYNDVSQTRGKCCSKNTRARTRSVMNRKPMYSMKRVNTDYSNSV